MPKNFRQPLLRYPGISAADHDLDKILKGVACLLITYVVILVNEGTTLS